MRVTALIFVRNPPQWRYPLQSVTLYPLIRLMTRSRWNHVALLCEQDKRVCVVEALGGGVRLTGWDEWRVRAVRTTERVPFAADGTWLLEKVGCPYDYASLLVWKLLKKFTGRWHGPRFEDAAVAVTCSELAAMACGIAEPWDKSPGDVYRHLVKTRPTAAVPVASPLPPST